MAAYKTALNRALPSVPARRLAEDGFLAGRLLDYGSGRGQDARSYGMDQWDPHYHPRRPQGKFDTVTCTYVLNVIEQPDERAHVLRDIRRLLKPGGKAYITVRNDRKALRGRTSRGTWQGLIRLDLPVLYRTGDYVTYKLEESPC